MLLSLGGLNLIEDVTLWSSCQMLLLSLGDLCGRRRENVVNVAV